MATLVTATTLDFGTVDVGSKIYRRVDVTLRGEDAALTTKVLLNLVSPVGSGTFGYPAEVWVQTVSGAVAVPLQPLPVNKTVTISDKMTDQTVLRYFIPWTPGTAADDASLVNCNLTQDINASPLPIMVAGTARIRVNVNLMMVLDVSGSMNDPGAGNDSKIVTLNKAVNSVEALLRQSDRLGVVTFSTAATLISGLAAPAPVAPLTAAGWTAIGEGITTGRAQLPIASASFKNAILLITDGMENRGLNVIIKPNPDNPDDLTTTKIPGQDPQKLEKTFAIGVGAGANINEGALTAFAGNSGGYLHVTGDLNAATTPLFQLTKFALQMVADASTLETLIDPEGKLHPGQTVVIPFLVSEADSSMDAIVLNYDPDRLLYFLRSPTGQLIFPGTASPAVKYVSTPYVTFYRVNLSALPHAFGNIYGTWEAVLRLREREYSPIKGVDKSKVEKKISDLFLDKGGADFLDHGGAPLAYSFLVHAETDVKLRVALRQKGHEPGDEVFLHASVIGGVVAETEVVVEITAPDGSIDTLKLKHVYGHQYRGSFAGAFVGTYSVRFRATGKTLFGTAFHREATRSASIYLGDGWDTGRDDPGGSTGGGGPPCRPCPCCCHGQRRGEGHDCHEHHEHHTHDCGDDHGRPRHDCCRCHRDR